MCKFEVKICELMRKYMTEDGFKLWEEIKRKTPNIMSRPASSTGKYHKNDDGTSQTIAEHTYEMLYACINIMRCLKIKKNTKDCDTVLLAIACHDICKYGIDDPLHQKYTDNAHDRIIGNTIRYNKDKLIPILSEGHVYKLEQMTRYHSGQWSTDTSREIFDFSNFPPEVMFVHMLDMLSTQNLIKLPKEKEETFVDEIEDKNIM